MPGPGPSRDGLPQAPRINRIVGLCAIAFVVAFSVHTLLGALGFGSDEPFRLLVTPLIGAAIVFFGLSGYPRAGRARLAVMVGVGLLLIAGMA